MSSVHPFQCFSASRISLSAKLLCKCSAQTLAHSQFMLIARTPTQQNLSTSFPIFFFSLLSAAPPKCNFESHNTKYVFIIPFCTLLMVCASWYVWGSVSLLRGRLSFIQQKTSCVLFATFVFWSCYPSQLRVQEETSVLWACSNPLSIYNGGANGTNGKIESSVPQPILYNVVVI